MPTAEYSRSVLTGLLRHGVSLEDLPAMIGIPGAMIRQILAGTGRLSDPQLATIERAIGLTAGQLAFLAIGKENDPVSTLLDRWAETRLQSHAGVRRA